MLTFSSNCVSGRWVKRVYEDPLAHRERLGRKAIEGIKEEEVRRDGKDGQGLKALWDHQDGVASKG